MDKIKDIRAKLAKAIVMHNKALEKTYNEMLKDLINKGAN